MTFLIAVCLSGAAAALLFDYRFPSLRPGLSWRIAVLLLSTYLVAAVSNEVVVKTYAWAGDFGMALAASAMIAYCFLVALWAFHAATDQLGSGGGGLRSKA